MSESDKQKQAALLQTAWKVVVSRNTPEPLNRSQVDMWARLLRIEVQKFCDKYDLDLFPRGLYVHCLEAVKESRYSFRR